MKIKEIEAFAAYVMFDHVACIDGQFAIMNTIGREFTVISGVGTNNCGYMIRHHSQEKLNEALKKLEGKP